MKDIIIELENLIKKIRNIAFILMMILLWGELILAFTKYKSIGVMIYDEYGMYAIGYYYLSVLIISFLFFYISNKLEYIKKDLVKTSKNE